jgi:hypothetical protein
MKRRDEHQPESDAPTTKFPALAPDAAPAPAAEAPRPRGLAAGSKTLAELERLQLNRLERG